jgi:hypothetical protein
MRRVLDALRSCWASSFLLHLCTLRRKWQQYLPRSFFTRSVTCISFCFCFIYLALELDALDSPVAGDDVITNQGSGRQDGATAPFQDPLHTMAVGTANNTLSMVDSFIRLHRCEQHEPTGKRICGRRAFERGDQRNERRYRTRDRHALSAVIVVYLETDVARFRPCSCRGALPTLRACLK